MIKVKTYRPYIAGALLGVLATLSVYMSTIYLGKPKYLGASTTFVRSAGLIEKSIDETHVRRNEYFQSKKVKVDWQFMLLVGIFIGAFIASTTDRSFKFENVPPLWKENFGGSVSLRAVAAFIGGLIAMYGARLAGGCPSGHGLSGLMQLSVSGFIAMIGFFGMGIMVAHLIYKKVRGGSR